MTENARGLRFGRFTIGFLGVVALAALLTGAVAAAGAPGHATDTTRTIVSAAGSESPGAVATAKDEASEEPTEAPKPTAAPSGAPTSAPTGITAGATCDPTLDKAEDQAEDQSQDQAEANEGETKGVEPSPEPKVAPEASEPPKCAVNSEPAKPDPDDAQGSGAKPGFPKALFNGGFEQGKGGRPGSFGQGR